MRSTILLGLLLCAVVAAASPATRIVGGTEATIDKYPSMVQIDIYNPHLRYWDQFCGASILNIRYVLSAAHCFDGPFYHSVYRRVRAGATFRNTGGVIIPIDREFNNPTFDWRTADGDISVIRLAEDIVYTPVIQRATIVAQGSVVPYNVPVTFAGWGATADGEDASEQLLDLTIFTIDTQVCADRYKDVEKVVTENMICAGILDVEGKNTCGGDSGGPMYYGGVVVGVVSWAQGCAEAKYPGVSTKVASYTDWIVKTAV